MRIAIISDIHGNLEAFENVLKDIHGQSVDCIASLGDNIGYGPDSEAVVKRLADLEIPSVLGNHELAVKNPKFLSWFNPQSRQALEQNIAELTPQTREICKRLPRSMILHGARLVHGFPPHSPTLYLFQIREKRLESYFQSSEESMVFIGHTHELDFMTYDNQIVKRLHYTNDRIILKPNAKYIVNAGSVGQPRDKDKRAKYLIWDMDHHHLQVRCVPYPIETVIAKMIAKGYPTRYAERLR